MTASLVCLACWPFSARAQSSVQFSGKVAGEAVSLNAPVKTYQNVPYVSLSRIVAKMGGKTRAEGTVLELSLAGVKASAEVNSTAVKADRGQFVLVHPVLGDSGNAYISLEDAERFFAQSFRVPLTRTSVAPEATAIDPSTPEEAPPETEDPKELLNTIELPPPPPAEPAPEEPSPEAPPVATVPAEPSPEAPAVTPAPAAETAAPAAPEPQPTVSNGPIKTIAVDAGHGGGDTGTMSPNGTAEKAVTAALAEHFEKALTEAGAGAVLLVRKEDREMSASDRLAVAVAHSAGLLVSVHAGAAQSPQSPLIQIYHAPVSAEGGDLAVCAGRAKTMAEAMAAALAGGDDAPTVAVRSVPLRLQTAAKMPCLMVEIGALNQPDGEAMLLSEEQRGPLVERIAKALAAAMAALNEKK